MPRRPHHPNAAFWRRLRTGLAAVTTAAVTVAVSLAAAPGSARAAATAPHKAARAAAAPGAGLLTQAQALARAHASGKPVQVTAATTSSSTLTANPNGTLTLTQESAPVRKHVAGKWQPLDASLQRGSDGTVSPAVTTSTLRLSGGGDGPLAVMTDDGASLSLTAPFRLPVPVLSGPTATYPGVLSGVDLKVTADDQGGFSEVLVVNNAAAAASPALRTLAFATRTTGGITLRADAAGNLTAATRGGHVIFSAPAPLLWDSAAPAASVPAVTNPATGIKVDRRTGTPLDSSAAGPGIAARAGKVAVRAGTGTLALVPDPALLTGKNTRYPVYIDPTYAAGSTEQEWTTVNQEFPTAANWRTSGLLQVGYDDWPGSTDVLVARSFVRESVPASLYTATIYSSTVYFTDEWSPSCTSEGVQLWLTGGISSSTDWSNQPGWNTDEASKSFAHGYDSSCPAKSEGFDITSLMKSAASGKWSNMTLGLRASDESNDLGWKQFSHTVTMSTTFDRAPNKPTALTTSPASTCSGGTTVGNGDVILYAGVSDPDGGNLSATFTSYNTATGATLYDKTVGGIPSGSTAPLRIPQATIDGAAGGAVTQFSWKVSVSDGTLTGPTSVTCTFKFDPTVPGQPSIVACEGSTGTIGTAVSFAVTPPTSGSVPTRYDVQLNGEAPTHVTPTAAGDATVTVTPTRGTDALTVTAVSAGGNVGDTATCIFTAAIPAPAADGDLTGDGIPDLITPGGPGTGLPSGLWLAKGQAGSGLTTGNGQVIPSGLDLGVEGNGIAGDNGLTGDYSPSDFNGTQVITGAFTGDNLQDTLAYYPAAAKTPYTGDAVVMAGNGDGSVLENQDSSNTTYVPPDTFTTADPNGDIPLQVANGYNADNADSTAYPDLITISGDPSPSSTASDYYLEYYQNAGTPGSWITTLLLPSATTPDGTMDWNNWTITTMAGATINGSTTADMFLYDSSTGALWLWQNMSVTDNGDGTGTAAYTPYQLSSSWNPGSIAELRAASITGAGPAVWAVTTAGTATAWTTTLTGTPAVTGGTAQTLIAPAHSWRLGDGTLGQATTAADTGSGSALPLTGNSGATWDTSDLFNPDVQFNGTTGAMTSTGPALTATSSFTVSVWVKPNTLHGVFLGQTGSATSCMGLAVNEVTVNGVNYGHYAFGMTTANSSTAPNWVKATAGLPMSLGVWSHITATYNASAKFMALYVDGIPTATATPSATWSSGCNTFTLGRFTDGGTATRYFNGKVADVQVWPGTALTPTQIATLSGTPVLSPAQSPLPGTPSYVLFPSDSHQYNSAATSTTWQWTTANAEMNFYQGKISIKETGLGTSTVTFGPGGSSSAVLTLQTDGNLVIYTNAADATAANTGSLWASGTQGNPGDAMFFQPDGNLVIYNTYGKVLWVSNTANS